MSQAISLRIAEDLQEYQVFNWGEEMIEQV